MIKVNYAVDAIDAVCTEQFDTIDEVKEMIEKYPHFDIWDVSLFDDDGYFVCDIEL